MEMAGDENVNIYLTLDFTAVIHIDGTVFKLNNIKIVACGSKHVG